MFDREQLGWVLRNGRGPDRTQLIGRAARGVLDRTQQAGIWPDENVRRLVLATGDEQFRAQCKLGRVKHGVLMILVDDVRRLYAYRLEWEQMLARKIKTECPGSRVRAVRFVHDLSGNASHEANRACRPEREEKE